MQIQELADRLNDLFKGVSPEQRPLVLKGWLAGLPDEHKTAATAIVGLFGFEVPRSRRVLILIHGIRTAAVWQDRVEQVFDGTEIRVIPIGYEYHDAVRFLLPFRRNVIRYVRDQLRQVARDWDGAEFSLIAHSFGTYIASRVLRSDSGVRFNRIAFCGSIVPAKFKWDSIQGIPDRDNFVNEVGARDAWPVLAKAFSWGYGTSGSFGFRQVRIQDRFHDLDHSGFFDESWIRRFWLPFFLSGSIVKSTFSRPNPPAWMHLVNVVTPKHLILGGVLLYVVVRFI